MIAWCVPASAQQVTLTFTGSELIIEGTEYDDGVYFGMTADRKTVYITTQTKVRNGKVIDGPEIEIPAFDLKGGGTRKIRFNGRNGSDNFRAIKSDSDKYVSVDITSHYIPQFPPLELFGGNGSDYLYGGSHADLIVGGDGNDNIYCGHGDDIAIPGRGDDSVIGYDGYDTSVGQRSGSGGEPYPGVERLVERNNETPNMDLLHGDWNGDGTTDRGFYVRSGWFLMPGSTMADVVQFGGFPADYPVVGKWEVSGVDRPGIYRPVSAVWHLDVGAPGWQGHDRREQGLQFGLPFEFPVVGDFHGENRDRIAVYSGGNFRVDIGEDGYDGSHPVEYDGLPFYGNAGDIPVIGDWNGDGLDDFGVYRTGSFGQTQGWWILDDVHRGENGYEQYFAIQHGLVTDRPIVGDFNGDGVSDLAVQDGVNGTGLYVK